MQLVLAQGEVLASAPGMEALLPQQEEGTEKQGQYHPVVYSL